MYRHWNLFATVLVICSSAIGYADEARISSVVDAHWYACEAPDDCAWLMGEGGWPVAVRASSTQAYREWVHSQAPFTTYFMPGDCFVSDEEFKAYVLQSKSRISCEGRRCSLDIDPKCTK